MSILRLARSCQFRVGGIKRDACSFFGKPECYVYKFGLAVVISVDVTAGGYDENNGGLKVSEDKEVLKGDWKVLGCRF